MNTLSSLISLSKFRVKHAEKVDSFIDLVRKRRASPTPENVRLAMSNRRMIRCLNAHGVTLTDLEDVEKNGPVVSFQLTPRARR